MTQSHTPAATWYSSEKLLDCVCWRFGVIVRVDGERLIPGRNTVQWMSHNSSFPNSDGNLASSFYLSKSMCGRCRRLRSWLVSSRREQRAHVWSRRLAC